MTLLAALIALLLAGLVVWLTVRFRIAVCPFCAWAGLTAASRCPRCDIEFDGWEEED